MEQIEVVAYKRKKLTDAQLHQLRMGGDVPGVLYGKDVNEQFYTPAILLKNIVYSSVPKIINFNLEGHIYKCILQEVQFHPVSEMILHVDLMVVTDKKPVTMSVPLNIIGANDSVGIKSGGLLIQKLRNVKITGLCKDIPATIDVDITSMEAGRTLRIENIVSTVNPNIRINIDVRTPVVEIKAQKK